MNMHDVDTGIEKPAHQRLRRVLPWYRDWLLLPIIGVVFLVDQGTKLWVRHTLGVGQSIPRDGAFQLTHVVNTGSAFGLFPNQTLLLILASLIGILVLLILYRNQPLPSVPLRVSLALQLGGAAGNLVDRVMLGHVTDFVRLGFWPVFNLADASIVVGIIMLSLIMTTSSKLAAKPTLTGTSPNLQTPAPPSDAATEEAPPEASAVAPMSAAEVPDPPVEGMSGQTSSTLEEAQPPSPPARSEDEERDLRQ